MGESNTKIEKIKKSSKEKMKPLLRSLYLKKRKKIFFLF